MHHVLINPDDLSLFNMCRSTPRRSGIPKLASPLFHFDVDFLILLVIRKIFSMWYKKSNSFAYYFPPHLTLLSAVTTVLSQ